MKIALTFDLRSEYLAMGCGEEETAEFDREETIESLEKTIGALGYETDRVGNIQRLVERLAAGDRWDLVFNIAEGLRGLGREAQVPALLDAYGLPYTFSDTSVLALCLRKDFTKRVLRDAGIRTAPFAVVRSPEDINLVRMPYPLFAKPVAEGTAKGIDSASVIGGRAELRRRCEYLLERYRQPVLVERYLSGRELTVGIVGTGAAARVCGTMEIHLGDGADPGVYSYLNKEKSEERVIYRTVGDQAGQDAERMALASWAAVGGRDAGRIDIRLDSDGVPQLLEINPLPGLHPLHSDLPILCSLAGMSYEALIGSIVISALERSGKPVADDQHAVVS